MGGARWQRKIAGIPCNATRNEIGDEFAGVAFSEGVLTMRRLGEKLCDTSLREF